MGGMRPQVQGGGLEPPGAGRGQRTLPRAYSKSTAQPTSIVDFWPQNRRNMISVGSCCPVCCYRRPRSWCRSHTAVSAELTEVGVVPGRPGCTPGGELGRLPVGGHPGLAPA